MMNKLPGKITSVEQEGNLSLVKISFRDAVFTAVVIDNPETSPYLTVGNEADILFKESEVILSRNLKGMISTQNVIPCRVKEINKGKLLSEVKLDFEGKNLISFITTGSAEKMGIEPGVELMALIKTNEVMIGYGN